MPRFIVEGAYNDGNDGQPVTSDLIVATDPSAAEAEVTEVRGPGWTHDRTLSFADYCRELREKASRLSDMTEAEVEACWAETKENLGKG